MVPSIVGVVHTVARVPRTDAIPDPFPAYSVRDGLHDIQGKVCAILDAPAVLIHALVAYILQELVNEVAVCAVDLDAVKPRTVYRI